MNRTTLCLAAVLMIVRTAALFAQTPDLTGTWKLDVARSRVTPGVIFAGLIRAGAPQTLHVTHAANGTVVIESQVNESHARVYRPGVKTTTPAGPAAGITTTSRWDGRTLVAEGNQEPASAAPVPVREAFTLSADGKTLTIEVEVTSTLEKTSSTFIYTRMQAVEPCRNWPSSL